MRRDRARVQQREAGVCQVVDLLATAVATSQLAADAQKLYFWGYGPNGYGLFSLAKAGGAMGTVHPAGPGQRFVNVRLDGTALYWSDGDVMIYRAELGSGSTKKLFDSTRRTS